MTAITSADDGAPSPATPLIPDVHYAHPVIVALPKDHADTLIADLDARIGPRLTIIPREAPEPTPPHRTPVVLGELAEWEDWAATGVTLFRYVTLAMGLPATLHLSTRLLSPSVRGKLVDLVEAIEAEAVEQSTR